MSLSAKHQLFVHEYLIDLNATQAAIRAGYSERTAGSFGHDLLKKPEIKAAIEAVQSKRVARLEATGDRVALELMRIAFSKLDDVMTWDESNARLVPSAELSPDVTPAIKEVRAQSTTTYTKDGDKQVHADTRIVMHNKGGALESLVKLLGLTPPTEEPEEQGPRRVRIELDTTNRLTAGEGD